MEKDWQARFRLSEPRKYGRSILLLFPPVSLLFAVGLMAALSQIRAVWGRAIFPVAVGCIVVFAAYRYQGMRSMKLFGLGTGVALACQLLLRLLLLFRGVPLNGWWSLLVLPVFALWPTSYIFALASVDAKPGTLAEQMSLGVIFALVNGASYTLFGLLVRLLLSPANFPTDTSRTNLPNKTKAFIINK